MLENAAESHTSGARFVRRFFVAPDSLAEKKQHCQHAEIFTHNSIFGNDQKHNQPKHLLKKMGFIYEPKHLLKKMTLFSARTYVENNKPI